MLTLPSRPLVSLSIVVTLCGAGYSSQAAQPPQYKIEHVPGLQGTADVRLSDAGHIVSGRKLWFAGSLQDLGGVSTYAMDVNASGQVVGRTLDGTSHKRPFLWQSGVMTFLPTIGGEEGYAISINNNGQIAGSTDNVAGSVLNYRATLWNSPSVATDVGTIGTDATSQAMAINNPGQIAAVSGPNSNSEFGWDAFLWSAGQSTAYIKNSDLTFTVEGINDSAEIVGGYLSEAYIWTGGQYKSLPGLGGDFSTGAAVNNQHQVVGSSIDPDGAMHAVTWINSQIYDLETLVPDLSAWDYFLMATDINQSGQIVGVGKLKNGADNQVFLLTPISSAPVITNLSSDHSVLWPPNNDNIPITLSATVQGSSATTWKITRVDCNESLKTGDVQIVDAHRVNLAASRLGKGNGRVYTIWVQAQNELGTLSKAVSIDVVVPHDQGK